MRPDCHDNHLTSYHLVYSVPAMGALQMIDRRAILILVLALCGCTGPSPKLVGYALVPPQTAESPYTIRATIRNTGSGEGEAQVTARIRSTITKVTAAEAAQQIYLSPHETVQVTFSLNAPRAGNYQALVKVDYPP